MKVKIENFFREIEGAWEAVPSYVKVFLYSASSSAFGLWVAGALDWRAVIIIVATNLGIYQVPRTIGTQTKRLMEK